MFLLQRFNIPLLTPFRENCSKMVISYRKLRPEPISGVKTAKKKYSSGCFGAFSNFTRFPPVNSPCKKVKSGAGGRGPRIQKIFFPC